MKDGYGSVGKNNHASKGTACMNNAAIAARLTVTLCEKLPPSEMLLKIRNSLIDMKNQGAQKEALLFQLNAMRTQFDEDLVLEAMDLLEGFCSPHLAISP